MRAASFLVLVGSVTVSIACSTPRYDATEDVASNATSDTAPAAIGDAGETGADAMDDALVVYSPHDETPSDVPSVAGTCGAPPSTRPSPPTAPTCAPARRGFRPIAQPDGAAAALAPQTSSAFTGSEVLALATDADAHLAMIAYDVDHDSWRVAAAPPRMRRHDVFAAGVWYHLLSGWFDGDGTERPLSVDVYDPATDTWSTLPPAPIVERFRAAVVWSTTTNELVIWGGTRADLAGHALDDLDLADGAAWNPATRSWRKLAPSPLGPRFLWASVWDGADLVVANGGRSSDGEDLPLGIESLPRAALYDPKSDAWTMLCDPPLFPTRVARVGAEVGDAGELGLFWGGIHYYGGDGDADPDFDDGSIFDGVTRTWRVMPPPNVGGIGPMGMHWVADGKLYAWGASASGVMQGAVLDPVRGWSAIADVWAPPPRSGAFAWTGCDLIMDSQIGWVAFRP